MDEDFSRQTRRFSAAILTYGKGNRRSMAGKRPAGRRAAVVNTGSYTGLLFLIMLIVPNLFWAKYPPKGYASDKENKILVFLERLGEICASCSLLIFSDLNPDREAGLWNLWLFFSGVIMLLYEYWWVRYFRSSKQLRDFYSSLLGIPVPGAVLPVAALLIMGIYGKVIWVVLSAAILGAGHIGIHLQHAKTLNSQ